METQDLQLVLAVGLCVCEQETAFSSRQANVTQPSLHIKEVPGNTAKRRFLASSRTTYITPITPPMEEQCITVSLTQEEIVRMNILFCKIRFCTVGLIGC